MVVVNRKIGSIKWFNEKLASQYVGCIMAKNPKTVRNSSLVVVQYLTG
jgi:hypothetical protein